ncbi:MAG: zinc-ribbon domain-containing protein, partial [Deltaproteobacteria bacterium]
MIIQCDRCSTKFRLDDSRVTGAGVRVKCTKCQNIFLVTPPEETPVEEILSVGPTERPEKERSIPRSPEGPNLSLDFTPPSDGPGPAAQEYSSSKSKDPALFSNFDFSFSVDAGSDAPGFGKAEDDSARFGEAGSGNLPEDEKWRGISQQAGRVGTDKDLSESDVLSSPNADDEQEKGLSAADSPFKGFDFSEADDKDTTTEVPVQDEWPIEAVGEDTYDLSYSDSTGEEEQEPVRPVSGAGEYTGQSVALKDEGLSGKDAVEPAIPSKDIFSKLLNESLNKDIKEKDVTVDEAEDEEDVLGFEPEEGFEAQGVTEGRT